MSYEAGEWIIRGIPADSPDRLKSPEELIEYVSTVGFLPLFRSEVPGLSVEEHTLAEDWWSDAPERDPWMWRAVAAGSGKVAYGKFFGGRAGFISTDWFPYFANHRRDGYDFDARWEDGKANVRAKKIMDVFAQGEEHFSFETKQLAGFGKGGEKGFESCVTALQMQSYLVVKDFRCRLNKRGEPYGWSIAVYAAPESIWGYDAVTSAYSESPEDSAERIRAHLLRVCPEANEAQIRKLLR